MLFSRLGDLAARRAPLVIGVWLVVLIAAVSSAPLWQDVIQNGEFAFLPPDAPSILAEQGFREAFPDDKLASNIVLVARRERRPGSDPEAGKGLTDKDREFIRWTLTPRLYEIVGLPNPDDETADQPDTAEQPLSRFAGLVQEIQTPDDKKIGDLLVSEDGSAALILLQLTTEFLDQANEPLVEDIEKYVDELSRTLGQDGQPAIPGGLDVVVGGSATFGRDMNRESVNSAKSTEHWTVLLVVFLLLVIYRAPLLALIPLLTVAVSTTLSLKLLSMAAQHGLIHLFNGIETYITVIVYGAGVDYCLFLIARYREELDSGATIEEAISHTLSRVGGALTASAGTVMCGIGMMVFAEFGKFRQAGVAITFSLVVCLLAALTLTPAVLRVFGRWAFWPNVPRQNADDIGFLTRSDWFSRLQRMDLLRQGWHHIGALLVRRPWTVWLASVLGMLPLAAIGVAFFGHLSYGLLSELPESSPSRRGTSAIQSHFPAGEVAPVTVLLEADGFDFSRTGDGEKLIGELTDALVANQSDLGLASIRSLTAPKGQRPQPRMNALERAGQRKHARDYYVSKQKTSRTRVDFIFRNDPFSRNSIDEFHRLRDRLPTFLPQPLAKARLEYLGTTPNISDLKEVTDRDQIRIDSLVLSGVYVILVILLRRPGICAYLIISVFYSYLATLGITFLVFWASDPSGFAGLDWKVPMFLFTILIAVGEDYNIFLMSRMQEEVAVHGPVRGITVALERTGSIISSCGIIMAGTFSSLLAGSLVGMDQLGFALAVGVLLDTFVVRPIMVPAFLLLLSTGQLGIVSRLAGYERTSAHPTSPDKHAHAGNTSAD